MRRDRARHHRPGPPNRSETAPPGRANLQIRHYADHIEGQACQRVDVIRRPFDDHDSASQFFRPDSFEMGSSMAGGAKIEDAA